jgi:hypothetical protein
MLNDGNQIPRDDEHGAAHPEQPHERTVFIERRLYGGDIGVAHADGGG